MFSVPSWGESRRESSDWTARMKIRRPALLVSLSLCRQFSLFVFIFPRNWRLREKQLFNSFPRVPRVRSRRYSGLEIEERGGAREVTLQIFDIRSTKLSCIPWNVLRSSDHGNYKDPGEERPSLLRTCDTAHRSLRSTFSTLLLSTHSNISRILSYSRDPIIYLKAHFRASFFVRLNIRWIRLRAA